MYNISSVFIIVILFSIFKTPIYAKSKLKRYIVKRNGIYKIEYHASHPKKLVKNHLIKGVISSNSTNSQIESAEEDKILNVQFERVENKQLEINREGLGVEFKWQWSLGYGAGGIEVEDGWDESTGSSNTVIAVVDTGILHHPELNGKILPGFDFVSDQSYSNDGNARDSNPADPGDWVTAGDHCYNGQFRQSSWHGTHVAGIIAANGNNSQGISGVDLKAKILPVRVLGKCGGFTSDIADGIRWAAGGNVSGVPQNQNPAKVINLSLGGLGGCGSYMQNAINFARSQGAVVIVAAGNDGVSINNAQYTPANCNGVITVSSNNQFGERSSFSNHGSMVDITAPGGGQGGGVLSLGNSGTTNPSSMIYIDYNGTSMATPHVAAVAGLIQAVTPGLFPDQIEDILEQGAKAFGFNSNCTNQNCGHGILNVLQSLLLAKVTIPDSSFGVDDDFVNSEELNPTPVEYAYESGGGFCGSIDFDSGDNQGGGNGPLSFITIFLIFLIMNTSKVKKLVTSKII